MVKIPNAMVGLVIGKGGENIKVMIQRSGANIQIQKDTEAVQFPCCCIFHSRTCRRKYLPHVVVYRVCSYRAVRHLHLVVYIQRYAACGLN